MSDTTVPQTTTEIPESTTTEIINELNEIKKKVSALTKLTRKLEKENKKLRRAKSKKRVSDPNKLLQYGIHKHKLLSNEMCEFLSVPHGTEMSYVDVTKNMREYVKKHELCQPNNKNNLVLDKPAGKSLVKLLQIPKDHDFETLTFFKLQKFFSPHIRNTDHVTEPVSEVVPEVKPEPVVEKVVKEKKDKTVKEKKDKPRVKKERTVKA